MNYRRAVCWATKLANWIEADLTDAMLPQGGLVLDEECLPLKPACLDGLVAFWGLHHVNDLPGALLQMRQALNRTVCLSPPCPAMKIYARCAPLY